MRRQRIKSPYCTNCGKELPQQENFCPECGQENDNKRQTFGNPMFELIQGFLSVDSRLTQSLPALLFRPGLLSKEYLRGRRQRYLDPIRMFITITVLYFLIASFGSEDPKKEIEKLVAADSTGIIDIETDSLVVIEDSPLSYRITDKKSAALLDSSELISNDEQFELDDYHYKDIKAMVKRGHINTIEIMDSLNIENTFWNRFYYGEVIKFAQSDFNKFKDYIVSKLPWIIFCMIPVFAFVLKLLYLRRKFLYIDHLIFSFHLYSFLFLTLILQTILEQFVDHDFDRWWFLIITLYTIFAFRNFYDQSYMKTIVKMFALLFIYSIAALFSLIFIMLIMFLLY
ncbi:MAG: DUF3667 domain-containing protein [Bacteroidetes bacterium]|nr:DUF3667 domain-containing protein [Bacteroidota bacterium]